MLSTTTGAVSVQFFQSVIAVELAISGALLFQIRYFDRRTDQSSQGETGSGLKVTLVVVLTATVFGALRAVREGGGRLTAVVLTVGVAVSLLPILLRVLRPLRSSSTRSSDRSRTISTSVGLALFVAVVAVLTWL